MSTKKGPDTIQSDNSSMYDNSSMHDNSIMYDNSRMRGSQVLLGTQALHCEILTVKRSDGHDFAYWPDADGVWMITAGFRYFDMAKAARHWTVTRGGTPLGDETMVILEFLEQWRVKFGQALWDARPPVPAKEQGE